MTRVYVPADLGLLAAWRDAGAVRGGPERVLAASEGEDDEAAALEVAASDSAAFAGPAGRRVVVVADTAGDPDADLPWRDVVAVHADLGAGTGNELAWVAVQEVAGLLDGSL